MRRVFEGWGRAARHVRGSKSADGARDNGEVVGGMGSFKHLFIQPWQSEN